MPPTSRLNIYDAACHVQALNGATADWMIFWAFDGLSGESAASDAAEAIAERIGASTVWNRRIIDAPFQIDYPYWISDARDPSDFIDIHPESGIAWTTFLDVAGGRLETSIDGYQHPWRLTVFGDVTGVPGANGRAVVVTCQLSHAFAVGGAFADISLSLFGAGGSDLHIPGLGPAAPRTRSAAAFLHALGAPLGLARYAVCSVGANLKAHRRAKAGLALTAPEPMVPGVHYVGLAGPGRVLRSAHLRRPAGTRHERTVTETSLTAISFAMQQHLAELGEKPELLRAVMQVALDWPELGVNRLRPAVVDLQISNSSAPDRAAAIARSVKRERERVATPDIRLRSRGEAGLPYPVLRKAMSAGGSPFMVHSALSSVRGPRLQDCSLLGARNVYYGGFPALGNGVGLIHGVYGNGEDIFVSVLSSPARIGDADRYFALLISAFESLGLAQTD